MKSHACWFRAVYAAYMRGRQTRVRRAGGCLRAATVWCRGLRAGTQQTLAFRLAFLFRKRVWIPSRAEAALPLMLEVQLPRVLVLMLMLMFMMMLVLVPMLMMMMMLIVLARVTKKEMRKAVGSAAKRRLYLEGGDGGGGGDDDGDDDGDGD